MPVPAREGDEAPTLLCEREARGRGARVVAGIDEVGRGAIGGPVVAAAVVLPEPSADVAERLAGVRDSKRLGAAARVALAAVIRSVALTVGVGRAEAVEVDALGIRTATEIAMLRALAALQPPADHALVDGLPVRLLRLPQRAIVGGDRTVLSIAAASIVAKVTRDAAMIALGAADPDHGWDAHKGYGVAEHLRALSTCGPTTQHRLTWAPMRPDGRGIDASAIDALAGARAAVAAARLTRSPLTPGGMA